MSDIVGRDPVAKSIVESFILAHPDESDEQIHARIQRAGRSTGDPDADLPVTVADVARWRQESQR